MLHLASNFGYVWLWQYFPKVCVECYLAHVFLHRFSYVCCVLFCSLVLRKI